MKEEEKKRKRKEKIENNLNFFLKTKNLSEKKKNKFNPLIVGI